MQSTSPPGGRVCHHCGQDIGTMERVGRRDTCWHCSADLHCCLNCTFYDPPSHNQCREPQAERQIDKEVGNFCEYFAFHSGPRAASDRGQQQRTRSRLEALFTKKQ
jgi:hypothetical protein